MRVVPTGGKLCYNGNQIGRYGRDIETNSFVLVWYHSGIGGEALWAMDTDVEWQISVSVDRIFVADSNNGLYAIDRDEFAAQTRTIDDREQCVMSATHDAVTFLGDPKAHLRGELWIDCDNAHGGYHKDKNHA